MKYNVDRNKIFESFRIVAICVITLFFYACANESVPQGGKQDTEPPQAKSLYPANKSLRFKSDKITIKFNEFLKDGGFSQTLISPPTEKRPEFKVHGKTLSIKLKSPLRDSTTYTINFGDDIKDLNEGNTAANFTYVFSTGDYIDSQKVSGTVLLAKDNSPAEGAIVSLYLTDSVDPILSQKPIYFAKVDKAGNYEIRNVKADYYKIYALKDQNFNYIFDQPNELIAFTDTLLNLNDTLPKLVKLLAFDDDKRKLLLDGKKAIAPGLIQFFYNKPIHTFKLNAAFYKEGDFAYFYPTKDTINYWYGNYFTKKDTLYVIADSLRFDTLRMEMKFIEKDSLFGNPKYALSADYQPNMTEKRGTDSVKYVLQELNKPLKIKFARPIMYIDESKKVQIFEDTVMKLDNVKILTDTLTKLFISASFTQKENTVYVAVIPDSTLQDIFGVWNKKIYYKFKTNGKDSYGNLRITLKTNSPDKYYVVKLLNAANEEVRVFYFTGNGERKVNVENILAGGYKFLVIDDENRNGEWDSGNFKKKRQPEEIFNYKEAYQLKGGWDLDIELKF